MIDWLGVHTWLTEEIWGAIWMAFRPGLSEVQMAHSSGEDTCGKAHSLPGLEDQKRDAGNCECWVEGYCKVKSQNWPLSQKCAQEAQSSSCKDKRYRDQAASPKAEFSVQTLPRKLSIEAKQNRNSNNHWRKITEYKKLHILIFKCAVYNPKLSGIQRTKKMEHSFKKKKKKVNQF